MDKQQDILDQLQQLTAELRSQFFQQLAPELPGLSAMHSRLLLLLAAKPGSSAQQLAQMLRRDKAQFKSLVKTLKAERPNTVGEEIASYSAETGRLSAAKIVPDEDAVQAPRRYEGETTRAFNQRQLAHYREQGFDLSSVAQMHRDLPHTRDTAKLAPEPRRELAAAAAEQRSGIQGVPRPPGPGRP